MRFALALLVCALAVVSASFNIEENLAIHEAGLRSTEYFYSRKSNMTAEGMNGASYGVDVSQATSTTGFHCLVNNGFSFAITRGYRSSGSVDPNGPQNVKNARAGGVKYVDFYMFPCPTCGGVAEQAKTAVNNMRNQGANFGMMWLDIEGPQYWHSSKDTNRQTMNSLLSGAAASGAHIGIYSSKYMWESLFGTGFTAGGNYPLWYAHYDNKPSFSDFVPFGGFSKPAVKQFSDQGGLCGVGYDRNFY